MKPKLVIVICDCCCCRCRARHRRSDSSTVSQLGPETSDGLEQLGLIRHDGDGGTDESARRLHGRASQALRWQYVVVDIQWYRPEAKGYDYRKNAQLEKFLFSTKSIDRNDYASHSTG